VGFRRPIGSRRRCPCLARRPCRCSSSAGLRRRPSHAYTRRWRPTRSESVYMEDARHTMIMMARSTHFGLSKCLTVRRCLEKPPARSPAAAEAVPHPADHIKASFSGSKSSLATDTGDTKSLKATAAANTIKPASARDVVGLERVGQRLRHVPALPRPPLPLLTRSPDVESPPPRRSTVRAGPPDVGRDRPRRRRPGAADVAARPSSGRR
jgi:hypothetical protein